MDLNTMYQNGMGPMASFFAGQSAVKDQQMADAKLQEQGMMNQQRQADYDQSLAMNPLNVQFRQGQVNQQAAELPGIIGQSQSQQAQGQYDQQTMPQRVAARLSSLGDQIGQDGMRRMGRTGEIAMQTASALDQYPPALHKELAPQIMAHYGVDPNDPVVQSIANMPDGQVQKALATVGSGMAMASGDFLQKSALETQKYTAEKEIAAGHDATNTANTKYSADKRLEASQGRINLLLSKMSTDDKISQLSDMIAKGEATDSQVAQYNQLRKDKLQQAAARQSPLPAQVTGNPTPVESVNPDPAFNAGNTPQPTPARPVGPPQGKLKQIGTSGGRPVFEDEKGNRFIK